MLRTHWCFFFLFGHYFSEITIFRIQNSLLFIFEEKDKDCDENVFIKSWGHTFILGIYSCQNK